MLTIESVSAKADANESNLIQVNARLNSLENENIMLNARLKALEDEIKRFVSKD